MPSVTSLVHDKLKTLGSLFIVIGIILIAGGNVPGAAQAYRAKGMNEAADALER